MSHVANEVVVYGGNGVCKISEIKKISFFHEPPKPYYILEPMFSKQSSVLYVPLDNEVMVSRIRPVLNRDEAIELLDNIKNIAALWYEDRNERKEMFSKIIAGGNREDILGLIKAVVNHREKLSLEGKRLNMQDEKALNEAESRISAEFAVALDMNPDEVPEYLATKLEA